MTRLVFGSDGASANTAMPDSRKLAVLKIRRGANMPANETRNDGLPELLSCPFCGASGVRTFVGHADIQYFHCDERAHGCGAVLSFSPCKIGDSAFAAWNRRASPSVGAPEWHLAHVDITPETARIKEGQVAPGPTIWVRREYWKAEIGTSTEIKFTQHELAKAHVPQPPKAIAPSVGGVRVPDGYLVVPIEPTTEMLRAGMHPDGYQGPMLARDCASFRRYYKDMVGAAPPAVSLNPAAEVGEVEALASEMEAASAEFEAWGRSYISAWVRRLRCLAR